MEKDNLITELSTFLGEVLFNPSESIEIYKEAYRNA